MKQAVRKDKDKVVKIIIESFDANPHVNFVIKNDRKRHMRIVEMARYAFEFGMRRNGVHLTDDGLGVAIIFEYGKFPLNLREYILQLGLGFKAFTIFRSAMVGKLEAQISKRRPRDVKFLYLWFFGVANEALGSDDARELMKLIFTLSADQKLPIFLETSIDRNSIIYKRYGFEEYDVFETGHDDLVMRFMKRSYEHKI